jgi:hypothetical protein
MDSRGRLMTSLRLRMRKICVWFSAVVACGALMIFTGCGSGDTANGDPVDPGPTNNPPPSGGDLAPASIGDNTIHGTFLSPHDHTTLLHFHITTTGGTTGTYTYEEENLPDNTGTYTWTKTGPDTAVIDTSNNGTLTFTYTSTRAGNYDYARPGYDEQGTFTTDQ